MSIREVIERHGADAHEGDPDPTAQAWEEAGFNAADVDEWMSTRCFDPATAEDLADAGITPQMAMMKTQAGSANYVDTVAFKVAIGDLEVDEARELVGAT